MGFRFKAQHPILRFIADFYCHAAKLIIELDGEIHLQQIEIDEVRTQELNYIGIKVIRFTNEEVNNEIEKVLNKIKEYLPLKTPDP